MKTDVQVAVIGGGIVGASVLYWLSRLGWTDSMLIERRELTSGSTWHAAGNTTYFGPFAEMTQLFAGSIRTYLQAEQDSGQSVSFHQTGSLRVATTPRELELFHQYKEKYKTLDIPYHVIDNAQIAQLHPCIDTNGLFGAAHTPTDGHVDPVGATNALAASARAKGASVVRNTPVSLLRAQDDGWIIETESGDIRAQHVVVATSFWTRELLQPLGINTPLYATEHHEMITGSIAELEALDHEVPAIRDSYASTNIRQEGTGFLAGIWKSSLIVFLRSEKWV